MELKHLEPNHTDKRGEIRDILADVEVDAVTYLTSRAGAIRGNHYHEQTDQWDYVLSGSFECYTRAGFDGEKKMTITTAGDLVYHPAGEHHALKAIQDSTMLSLTKGPRRGTAYEKDVVSLKDGEKLA